LYSSVFLGCRRLSHSYYHINPNRMFRNYNVAETCLKNGLLL